MTHHAPLFPARPALFTRIAAYAEALTAAEVGLDAEESCATLRRGFDIGLPDEGRPVDEVIDDLINAAEPGLVGSTREGFLAWVIGGSSEAGVAADWLTGFWGQNGGIYQTSPAAAMAEEACERWLLDLLDLPRESSIGFVTGATMASFVGLAVGRNEVLRRAGHDIARGLQAAPRITVLVGADAHVSNHAALRYLGLGSDNVIEVPATAEGVMDTNALRAAASTVAGPAIVVAQAGHIHSGAFDDFEAVADVAEALGGWLHVDGAFGLWARAVAELRPLCRGLERADSWSLDGHKWLQVPYDSGFAIVRDRAAHARSMAKVAGYLNIVEGEGRNPADYAPELSRRARGFAVWTMLQTLGRNGLVAMVRRHCAAARELALHCVRMDGVDMVAPVVLNQVALDFGPYTRAVCDSLNAEGDFFLRTAEWRGRTILRISFAGEASDVVTAARLADRIESVLARLARESSADPAIMRPVS